MHKQVKLLQDLGKYQLLQFVQVPFCTLHSLTSKIHSYLEVNPKEADYWRQNIPCTKPIIGDRTSHVQA